MKNTFYLLTLSLLLISCLPTNRTVSGTRIHAVKKNLNTHVLYQDYEHCVQEQRNKASKLMWDDDLLQKKIDAQPSNGLFYVTITGNTIDMGSTGIYDYVFEDSDGNQVYRREGKDQVADYSIYSGVTIWKSMEIFALPNEVQRPFTVHVINRLTGKKGVYHMSKDSGKSN